MEASSKVTDLQKSVLLAENIDATTALYIAIETEKVEVVNAAMALDDVAILKAMFSYTFLFGKRRKS